MWFTLVLGSHDGQDATQLQTRREAHSLLCTMRRVLPRPSIAEGQSTSCGMSDGFVHGFAVVINSGMLRSWLMRGKRWGSSWPEA